MAAGRVLFFSLLLSFQLQQSPAQSPARDASAVPPPPTGTASVAGTLIVDNASNQPIRKARVTLKSTDGAVGLTTTSDDNGRFLFRNLPALWYVLEANKVAWLKAAYGARRPGRSGTPIAVADGQRVTGVTIRMTRGAVVTGTVRDHLGQPAVGVRIQVLRFSTQNGERVLDGVGSFGPSLTDDTGTYRIFGLPAGEVVVAALLLPLSAIAASDAGDFRQITTGDVARAQMLVRQGGSSSAVAGSSQPTASVPAGVKFASVFYPGAADPTAASTISLAAGEERTGVDFALQLVPTARVTGVIIGLDGAPLARGSVVAISGGVTTALGIGLAGLAIAPVSQNGEYQLGGLAPGPYALAAGGETGWAKADIEVNGQDMSVSMRLQPGASIRGRVVFDGAQTPPAATGLQIGFNGIGPLSQFVGRAFGASVQNGAFSVDELIPGAYRLRLDNVPGGWYAKSAVVNGRDVLDGVLDIQPQDRVTEVALTLTNRPSELAGSLRDATGGAAPDYFIIVFSADRTHWTASSRRLLQTRPANDGAFTLKGLPAGDYYIAALTDVEPDEWLSPAFLESVVGAAVKVTIVDGQKTVQDLEIKRF
jgi:hypothetical protein